MVRCGTLALLWLALASSLGSTPLAGVSVEGAPAPPELALQAGQTYRPEQVSSEVRRLWRTGRYADISVTANEHVEGVHLNLRLTPRPFYDLRRIRVRPYDDALARRLRRSSPVTREQVREIVDALRAGLIARGYREARVKTELEPLGGGRADLAVAIERGRPWRVDAIQWEAPDGSPTEQWERELRSLRRRTFFPGLPPLWRSWRSKAVYSEEALRADLARLESRLLAEGRLDARASASSSFEGARARVTLSVEPGPRYRFGEIERPDGKRFEPLRQPNWRKALCRCALAAQRQAEREGRLDFAARLDFDPIDGDLASGRLSFQRGLTYQVGRIEFRGPRDVTDRGLRRALRLEEAKTFDLKRLRQSLARLRSHPALEPVTPADVTIERRPGEPVADVVFDIDERPRGRWSLSGPLGPMSWFGGLSFSVESRLPGWGGGLWRLSALAVSASVFSWERPVLTALGWDWQTAWTPLVTLRRPLTPGRFWTSGWSYAPQLGWKGSLAVAGMERARSLGATLLAPRSPGGEAALPVFVATDGELERRASLSCRQDPGPLDRSKAVLARVLALAGLLPR